MKSDINKFSFAQMTSNSSGKTSASGTMGVLTISMGLLSFLIGVLYMMFGENADTDIMVQAIVLIGMGTGLLGYRKSRDVKGDTVSVDEPIPADPTKPVWRDPNLDDDPSGGDEILHS